MEQNLVLDLERLKKGDTFNVAAEFPLPLPAFLGALNKSSVSLNCAAAFDGEVLTVKGRLLAAYDAHCDKCLKQTKVVCAFDVDERFSRTGSEKTEKADLAETAREIIISETERKILCRVDCLGLCPVCGQDLNEKACSCETKHTQTEV